MSDSLEKIVVVAGIPPDNSGTGRMVRQLMATSGAAGVPMRFVHKARPAQPLRLLLRQRRVLTFIRTLVPYLFGQMWFYAQVAQLFATRSGKLLILHPQSLGFGLTNKLLDIWPRNKVFMYVLDSSYFCVRSYNHIAGERDGCTRCLGGDFSSRDAFNCQPWPIANPRAGDYTDTLLNLARDGGITLLSQNKTQAELLRRHFGERARITVVGLWGEEWTAAFDGLRPPVTALDGRRPRIVIHSHSVEAKGANWFFDLAPLCPEIDFVCPFPKPVGLVEPAGNLIFAAQSWENGLQDTIASAHMVAVPSLWSAPVEGALVKSLVVGQRVVTVENETSLQHELPDSVVLRLPSDPQQAAPLLSQAITSRWSPDAQCLGKWIEEFRAVNEGFAGTLIGAIREG